MKPLNSTQDQVKGTARIVKGRMKKAVGALTGNREMENKGKVEETSGRIQKKVGEVEKVLGD